MIIIFGDNTSKKIKTTTEQDMYFIDRKNTGDNIYFSLENFFENHSFDSEDILISFSGSSPLDFRLNFPVVPYDILVVITKDYNIDEVLSQKDLQKKDYKIFSGSKIESKEKSLILENITLLSDISYQMMEAGYLDIEDNKKIEDWIITFQEPLLQLFVNYLKPETSNPTMTVEDEFLINPSFRKTILLGMIKILSNFIVNNEYITIKDVSNIGTWTNYETWLELRKTVEVL